MKKLFSLLAMLVLLCGTMLAQETTGGIQGIVTDKSGAVVPDATVVLSSPALLGDKVVKTDHAGYYRYANLLVGVYAVSVKVPGFAQIKKEDLRVSAGRLLEAPISLAVGTDTTVVEVQTDPAEIDTTISHTQTTVTQDEINYDPRGRSFQSVIQYAPGSRVEPLQGNGYSIDGATSSENQYLINGIPTSALDSGLSKANIPFEFISEVQVKTSGIEAEFGGALGGVVTAVQKQGGTMYHGEVFTYFELDPFDAAPASYTRFNPQVGINKTPNLTRADVPLQTITPLKDHARTIQPGFVIGGSLIKNRLWTFTGFEPLYTSLRRQVNFNYSSGTPTQVSIIGPRLFTQDTQQYFFTQRFDVRATDKIRLFGAWLYQYYRAAGTALPNADDANGLFNSSSTSNPDNFNHGIGNVQPNSTYTFGADVTLSNSLVATTRYGYFYNNYQDRGLPVGIRDTWNATGLNVTAIDGSSTGVAGTTPASQSSGFSNIAANSQYLALQNVAHAFTQDLAYYKKGLLGQHNFKGGYGFNHYYYNTNNNYNTALVQLYWGQKYSPLTANQPACAAIEATNKTRYGGKTDNLGNTTIDPTSCMGDLGYALVRDYSNGIGHVSEINQAFYIQDAVTLGRGVTVNAGVRFEKEYVPAFNNFPSGINFGFGSKVVPRLGAAWDVFRNGKMKVFGSYGAFNDIFKLNLAIGSFGGNYWHNCAYALDSTAYGTILPQRDSTGHYCSGTGEANFAQGSTPTNLRFIENQNYRVAANDPANPIQPGVDPNLKPFRQHESVLGVAYEVMPSLQFESRWSRRRVDHAIEDTGIQTAVGEAFPISNPGEGIDAQPVPNCPGCRQQPKAARAYDAAEFRLTKVASNHWFGQVSYTYSRLRGNYSGLVDSDQADGNATTTAGIRTSSPNSGRAFDEPYFQFDAHGKAFNGLLATDRPHTAKLIGYYRFKYLGKHETTIGGFQNIYSGTPLSSYLDVGGSSSYQVYPEGRAMFTPVTADPTTGVLSFGTPYLRRTPVFFQTDLQITHSFAFSPTHSAWRLGFEGNITNLMNAKTAVIYGTKINSVNSTNFLKPAGYNTASAAEPTISGLNYAVLESGYDWKTLANTPGVSGAAPLTLNSQYGVPTAFQAGRSIRMKVKFTF